MERQLFLRCLLVWHFSRRGTFGVCIVDQTFRTQLLPAVCER